MLTADGGRQTVVKIQYVFVSTKKSKIGTSQSRFFVWLWLSCWAAAKHLRDPSS